MAFVAIIGTVLSGIFSAVSAMSQAKAASEQANYQSQVAAINAQIDRQRADRELLVGETQAQEEGMKAKANVGAVVAQEGASGLDVNTGSKAAVISSTQRLGQYNEALVRSDAAKRSYDYRVQGFEDEAQSRLYSFEASNYKTAGTLSAVGSLLGTAGSVAGKWYQFGGAPNVLGG